MTPVLFLWDKPIVGGKKSVFAYFPTIPHSNRLNTCYAHIGQHSPCDPNYAKSCKEAAFNEYYHDLLPELIGQGYTDLKILNTQPIEYHRQPTKSDIVFGHGAMHYREFPLSECVNPKTGDLKKWLKADDGLRYYR